MPTFDEIMKALDETHAALQDANDASMTKQQTASELAIAAGADSAAGTKFTAAKTALAQKLADLKALEDDFFQPVNPVAAVVRARR